MKKKSKSAETMAAQSTFPGYVGIPNLPHLATATEASSNSGLGIKYCPDDWLDLGVGEHVYPIDPDNPVGHKCKSVVSSTTVMVLKKLIPLCFLLCSFHSWYNSCCRQKFIKHRKM